MAVMEAGGLKAVRRRASAACRISTTASAAVPEGKVDASFTAVGIGVIEEANAMEPIRFLSCAEYQRRPTEFSANYGASVVKSDPATGIKGETYVIGYPLQLVSSDQSQRQDRLATCSKPGGTI